MRFSPTCICLFLMIIVDMSWSHDTSKYHTHPVDSEMPQTRLKCHFHFQNPTFVDLSFLQHHQAKQNRRGGGT